MKITIRDKTDTELINEVALLTGLPINQIQITRSGSSVTIQTIKVDGSDQAVSAGIESSVKSVNLTKVE